MKPASHPVPFEAIHITTTDGEPRVSTETIAEGVGVQHHSVMRLLRKHAGRMRKYGVYGFEIHKLSGAGRPTKFAMLNEPQATLLLTLVGNTEKAVDFKDALVYEFFRMREALRKLQPPTIPELKKLSSDSQVIGSEGSMMMNLRKRAKKFVDGALKIIVMQPDLLEDQAEELKRLNMSTRERQNSDKAARLAAPSGVKQ